MCRGPPPVNPPPQKFSNDSAPKDWPQEQPTGHKQMTRDSPPLRNTVSSPPRPASQISSQKANYSSDPISRSPGANGGQNTRPHASSGPVSQDPPSDTDSNRSENRTDFRSILGGKNAPRREKGNKWLSELSVRKRGLPLLISS